MAGTNLSVIDEILQNIYIEPMRDQVADRSPLLTRLEKGKRFDSDGKGVVPMLLQLSEAVGARGDDEDLPEAQYTTVKNAHIGMVSNYGRIRITGPAMRYAKNNPGSLTNILDLEMKSVVRSFRRDIDRQLYGLGTGEIVKTADAGSGYTVEVVSTQYLRTDMLIDFYTAVEWAKTTGAVATVSGAKITAINRTTNVITTDKSLDSVVAGEVICRASTKGKEIVGLRKVINNTGTFQQISCDDYEEWRSVVSDNEGVPRALTEALIDEVWSELEPKGTPSIIITTYELRDAYANILKEKRQQVNTMKLEGGFTGIEYKGIGIIAETDCPAGHMFFLDESQFNIFESAPMDWIQADGNILARVANRDAYTAAFVWDSQLGCMRLNTQGVLKDLSSESAS